MIRHCMLCGREIKESMGSVHAGDFVKASNGEIPWDSIRERCGICVMSYVLRDYELPTLELGSRVAFALA